MKPYRPIHAPMEKIYCVEQVWHSVIDHCEMIRSKYGKLTAPAAAG